MFDKLKIFNHKISYIQFFSVILTKDDRLRR